MSTLASIEHAKLPIAKKLFPFLQWLPLDRRTLRADLIAGVTVALLLIPQSMAYAQLAGLPAHTGLYAAFLPGIIAALWGSSKQLATGPVAIVSLMTASALALFAESGSPDLVAMAVLLALLVGLVQLALGLLRLGVVVNLISYPVILGFANGAALIIGLSQLDKMLGLSMPRGEHLVKDIWAVLQQVGDIHVPTLIMGLVAFAIILGIKKGLPKAPGVLVAVTVTTLASWIVGYEALGGKVVGEIPSGLPTLAIPRVDFEMASELIASAVVISLVGFMEAISIAKVMAAKTKDRLEPNQELIGQGLANITASLSQAYPASGSFSRSAVNLNAGARTSMSSVFTGTAVLITLLFLTPLLHHLPQSVLAAVVMLAVVGLINFKAIKKAWNADKPDGVIAVATFVATLAFAPQLDLGILTGVGLAIGLFLYRSLNPPRAHPKRPRGPDSHDPVGTESPPAREPGGNPPESSDDDSR